MQYHIRPRANVARDIEVLPMGAAAYKQAKGSLALIDRGTDNPRMKWAARQRMKAAELAEALAERGIEVP